MHDKSQDADENTNDEDEPQDDHNVMVKDVLRVLTDEFVLVDNRVTLVLRTFLNLRIIQCLS